MTQTPILFETKHQILFSDLDPYKHMRSDNYASYFVNHRMLGLRKYLGWDQKALETAPFMVWMRRIEIDFKRPVWGDCEVVINSYVLDFNGPDAFIECTMTDGGSVVFAKCLMIVAHVDKEKMSACDWPEDRKALFFQ